MAGGYWNQSKLKAHSRDGAWQVHARGSHILWGSAGVDGDSNCFCGLRKASAQVCCCSHPLLGTLLAHRSAVLWLGSDWKNQPPYIRSEFSSTSSKCTALFLCCISCLSQTWRVYTCALLCIRLISYVVKHHHLHISPQLNGIIVYERCSGELSAPATLSGQAAGKIDCR